VDRVPEPELMLDEAQALAYARADFEVPHRLCLELLQARHPDLPRAGRALDLGCGPGDVTFRFARAFPEWTIDGVDGSPAMLALARAAAERTGYAGRTRFQEALIPRDPLPAADYDLVLSNSLLHHLPDPAVLWATAARYGRAGAAVFVMDLFRPADEATVEALVVRHTAGEPDVLQRDFRNSLRAAFRPDEVEAQLAAAGLTHLTLETVTDRHLVVAGRLAAR
jgi:SAM-dependent methyltransferase